MQASLFPQSLLLRIVSFPVGFVMGVGITVTVWKYSEAPRVPLLTGAQPADQPRLSYLPRARLDSSGFSTVLNVLPRWDENSTLEEVSRSWERVGYRNIDEIERMLKDNAGLPRTSKIDLLMSKAYLCNYEGEPRRAVECLQELRALVESDPNIARQILYSVIYLQGVTALRLGETENCVMCRGESSCILPIAQAAVHTKPEGSRLAIERFTEYLAQFPEDLEVCWLLNLAHMTLGEHPNNVNPKFVVSLARFTASEFDIGRFRDVGHIVGVNRFNQAGGAIMEDFDNDGLLDLAATTWDATAPMALYRNTGTGTFEDRTASAGIQNQLGGLNCVQTDYNNDGYMDIFIIRGAWIRQPVRPTLLRNEGNGSFTDVTEEAGLLHPVNSIAASWADFDNDGWLDLFICCERQPNRLYRNLGNGKFEEMALRAGVIGELSQDCKGVAWIDYDNDGFPDLFLNYLTQMSRSRLFRNNRDGSFSDVSRSMNINGPAVGFSCWAWDYDNDGWLDLFATCYDRSLGDTVKGLLGEPHKRESNRLYRNNQGSGFEDKTREAGLDVVLATMGSNFSDFDNDGYLDMYLGTGQPDLEFLAPNRMFKNVAGKRFAEITGTSRTGNLQKGHGVACGDWDCDGDNDIFIEMGGATHGDKYHNILFQNPGQGNHWITVKLVGKKTNRAAIGARIKVVATGDVPLTVHRHVSTGSSFGANPLQQTIGLARSDRIVSLEVYWPTSGSTQIFRDLKVDQAVRITEFADDYETLDRPAIAISD